MNTLAAGWIDFDRHGSIEFERAEERRTRRRRELSCGHVIDPREPYRYYVAKVFGVAELLQVESCEECGRYGSSAVTW